MANFAMLCESQRDQLEHLPGRALSEPLCNTAISPQLTAVGLVLMTVFTQAWKIRARAQGYSNLVEVGQREAFDRLGRRRRRRGAADTDHRRSAFVRSAVPEIYRVAPHCGPCILGHL